MVLSENIVQKEVKLRKKIIKKRIVVGKVKTSPPTQQRKWIPWRERFLLGKVNPNKKKYYAFFFKTKNNVFITITDVKGQVVVSQSAGSCKITTKKKKKSWDTLKAVAASASKIARIKNIRYIWKFFMTSTYMKNGKIIFQSFKQSGLSILKAVIVRNRPHSLPMRKKKLKRL